MKIEEKFYTISYADLKWLCKKHSYRFQKGFDEEEFLIFFEENKDGLLNQHYMSELIFTKWIDSDND
jgi:hypothetical protein